MNPMHTVSSQQPAASSQHSNNFDAIRIAAALAVLVSHHYALTAQAEPSFLGLHTWGGTAVIVFFVISGYLVTSSWYNDPSALRFAQRRILRIWPALAVVVVLTAYGLGAWVTSLPLMEYWKHRATLDYLLNIKLNVHYVLPGVFESNPYPRGVNGSLWTIPLEVRCYVVMALAGLLGLMRYRGVWMLLIAAYLVWFMTKGNADVTGKVNYGRELSAHSPNEPWPRLQQVCPHHSLNGCPSRNQGTPCAPQLQSAPCNRVWQRWLPSSQSARLR